MTEKPDHILEKIWALLRAEVSPAQALLAIGHMAIELRLMHGLVNERQAEIETRDLLNTYRHVSQVEAKELKAIEASLRDGSN